MDESRRRFMQTAAAAAACGATPYATSQTPLPDAAASGARGEHVLQVTLSVNGRPYVLAIEPRVTLLDALREYIGLSGTKKGCDRGQCGACTVLVEDRRINACLTLAVAHAGERIRTIEGLADGASLHPVQAAFIEHDGFQCGYCTPGQICSAVALLGEVGAGGDRGAPADVRRAGPVELTDAEIRERMSGNLCRCGAYVGIVEAVRDASK